MTVSAGISGRLSPGASRIRQDGSTAPRESRPRRVRASASQFRLARSLGWSSPRTPWGRYPRHEAGQEKTALSNKPPQNRSRRRKRPPQGKSGTKTAPVAGSMSRAENFTRFFAPEVVYWDHRVDQPAKNCRIPLCFRRGGLYEKDSADWVESIGLCCCMPGSAPSILKNMYARRRTGPFAALPRKKP